MKALATRPGSSFQFVLKTELQTFIDNKANSKHGAAVPSQKKKDKKTTRSSTSTPLELDPSTLQLDAAHFVDDDGDCVPQIPLTQVVADGRGLAIATVNEALPYLREKKNISHDALALLITEDVPAHLKGTATAATVTSLRFPVTYLPTSDPLLIHGCILQLGDHEVHRVQQPDPATRMDVAETHVLTIQLFRDELSTLGADRRVTHHASYPTGANAASLQCIDL